MNCNPGTCEECRETATDDVPYRTGVERSGVPALKNRLEIVDRRRKWWVARWEGECGCPRTQAEVK